MNSYLVFLIGLMIGAFLGMLLVCIFSMAHEPEFEDDRWWQRVKDSLDDRR